MGLIHNPGNIVTVIAPATVEQYTFLNFAGAQAGAGAKSFGVTMDGTTYANEPVGIAIDGVVLVKTGGAIAVGAAVASDASGRAITLPGTGTPAINGYAVEEATAANQYIAIKLV